MKIVAALDRPYDNFAILRLLLSVAVIISHTMSIGLTGLTSSEIAYASTGFTLGEHAVNGFFAISGFLIAMSWERRPKALVFSLSRFLRLVPGLVGAALLTTFLIGAYASTLPFRAYITDQQTWQFLLELVFRLRTDGTLPGAFIGNPVGGVMGTVWSLKYEIGCYFGLLVLGVTGLLLRPYVILAIVLFFGLGLLAIDILPLKVSITRYTGFRLRFIFALGAMLYVWRARIPVSALLSIGLVALTAFLRDTPCYRATLFLSEAYLFIFLAIAPGWSSPKLALPFDFSYGIYLYGMPVQQTLTSLYHPTNPYTLLPVALLVSTLFAAFSWYWFEKPALALKPRLIQQFESIRLPWTKSVSARTQDRPLN